MSNARQDEVEPGRRHRPHFHTDYLNDTSTSTYDNCVKASPVVSAARDPLILFQSVSVSIYACSDLGRKPGKRVGMDSTNVSKESVTHRVGEVVNQKFGE